MKITKSEIVKIITAIKIQCPDTLPYRNESEFDILVDMWFEILKEYPKDVVWAAVRNALKNTVYQKQNWIGAISQEIEKMRDAYSMSDTELWHELTAVLREVESCAYKFRFNFIEANGKTQGDNAIDRVRQIYSELPKEIQEYCGGVSKLIDIAQLDKEKLSYEKGRFLKVMPTIKERAKTKAQTGNMAGLLQGLNVFLIEGNTEH